MVERRASPVWCCSFVGHDGRQKSSSMATDVEWLVSQIMVAVVDWNWWINVDHGM